MRDIIEARGSRDEIIKCAMEAGIPSEEIAGLCLNMLCKNPSMLPEDNIVEITKPLQKPGEGTSSFILGGDCYYVRVRPLVFMFSLLFAGDATLKAVGMDIDATTVAAMFGSVSGSMFNNLATSGLTLKLGFKLYEKTGEKCILLEYAKNREPMDAKEIKQCIGKTCRKRYDCDFLKNGKCTCKKKDIEDISNTLCSKGALEPNGTGYKYVLW